MELTITNILEIHDLSSGARRALLGLLTFRNKNSGKCCPSITTLAQRLGGVPYSTLRRWLHELRVVGLLEITKHRGSNSYQIDLSKTCEKSGGCEQPESSKMSPPESSKVSAQESSKMSFPNGRILNEQTVLNRQGGTRAADKLRGSMGPPVKKAAAAAAAASLPLFDDEPSAPAPPPATPKPAAATGHESPQVHVQPQDQIPALARAMAGELGKVHPQPGLLQRAVPEIERILRAGPTVEAAGERIWNNHAAWREYWATLEAGRFIPQLWRWFRDGDWETPPVIRKPAGKESRFERITREWAKERAAGRRA